MKTKLTLLLMLLLTTALGAKAEKEMYTVLSPDGTTLTYYYDDAKDAKVGTICDVGYNDEWNIYKVIFHESFADARPTSTRGWFYKMRNLTEIVGLEYLNTSKVTDMYAMFYSCERLDKIDVSHFDTSNVTDMSFMFYMYWGNENLTSLDVSHFDTSNVKNMRGMFAQCDGLTSLDLSHFDTSNVTNMNNMFRNCCGLTSLDVSDFDTSEVTDMAEMFFGCGGLKNLDLSHFDTSNVTIMKGMFEWCSGLTSLDVSHFDTSNVIDMFYMFAGCNNLTSLDVSHFDTSNVTEMGSMFDYCYSLTSLDVSHFDTSNVKHIDCMFEDCNSLTSLDVSHFDTSNVYSMYYMFSGCSGLTSLDLSNFNTSKVYGTSYMFAGCSGLTSLDLSSFDMSNVQWMDYMFSGCSGLTSLDVSHFDTSNVIESQSMLSGCSALEQLSVSSTMTNLDESACEGVGTEEAPCVHIAPEGFDYGVDTSGDYFQWKSGYFMLEDDGPVTIAELTLDENTENEIPESGTVVQTVNTVRTLVGGVWNTFCLPFTVTADEMADESHPLHGATIMTLTDAQYDGNAQMNLKFSQVDKLTGGEPYVIKVPKNVVNPIFHNVTITSQEPRITRVGFWQMIGLYSPYTFRQADKGIYFITGGNKFSYVAEPGTMKGMRAYFMLQGYFDYANIAVCFDDATGITQLRADDENEAVYDLQGRLLNHAPAHGVYITNGKKYVK